MAEMGSYQSTDAASERSGDGGAQADAAAGDASDGRPAGAGVVYIM